MCKIIIILLTFCFIFSLMQAVITYVRCNDLAEPIIRVALERSKHQTGDHPFSIYRDILFLAFIVLGRTNIDQGGGYNFKKII